MAHAFQPTAATTPPRRPDGARRGQKELSRRHQLTRLTFHLHLWLGVLFTVVLLVISITGIALNHKRGLGFMPDVAHAPTGEFGDALPLAELAAIGLRAGAMGADGQPAPLAHVDRMDVRPRDGYVKVRLRDAAVTEVTVDLTDGRVLHVGPRADSFLEKVHSGEVFGDGWILLSDAGAIALVIVLASGYWLWMAPRLRGRAAGGAEGRS